jgi:hypothetical protein
MCASLCVFSAILFAYLPCLASLLFHAFVLSLLVLLYLFGFVASSEGFACISCSAVQVRHPFRGREQPLSVLF